MSDNMAPQSSINLDDTAVPFEELLTPCQWSQTEECKYANWHQHIHAYAVEVDCAIQEYGKHAQVKDRRNNTFVYPKNKEKKRHKKKHQKNVSKKKLLYFKLYLIYSQLQLAQTALISK